MENTIHLTDNLGQIAQVIDTNWKPAYFGARPYINAMRQLTSIHDRFGEDQGKTIVLYFLSNASTWRGPTAKLVKAKLKALLKAA